MTVTSAPPPPDAARRDPLMLRVGRVSARHGWWVVLAWLVLLVGATLGHRVAGGEYSDQFQLPGSSAQRGAALLATHEPQLGGQNGQLVFTVDTGTLQQHAAQLDTVRSQVAALPHVLAVSDPLSAGTTSRDGRTAYASVQFDVNPTSLGSGYVDTVDTAVQPARAAGVQVDYGGVLGQAARPKANDTLSELIGIAVALVVLLIGFGSVYAAGLPIVTAGVGVATGLGVLGMVAATTTFASVSPTLAVMIGLGVGIDYALFLTTRHRQLVLDGVEPSDAAARAVASSGRAVLIAAVTVVIAMLGLFASGIPFVGKLGLAASIAVAVAALAAITLVPALLGLAGRHIDRLHLREPVAERGRGPHGADGGAWHRYAERIERRPWQYLVAGVAVLAVLAVPTLSMTLGHIDAGADPTSFTDKRAYDEILHGVRPRGQRSADGRRCPRRRAGGVPDAGPADRAVTDAGRGLGEHPAAVPGRRAAGGHGGADHRPAGGRHRQPAVAHQRHRAPLGPRRDAAQGYVTGTLPANLNFRDRVAARLPIIIGVVIAAAFLLLLMSFRAPVLALKAAVLNLLSIGAAYGVVVAVFQWGWGGSLFGVSEKVPIESYVPMMMFAIVFGLSMDYEVFLLSRIRERWFATNENGRSVADGLSATARVITCAALIMTSVFLAFLLSSNVVIKMLALGLGVSVLIDATLIRLLVVPATMFLLGRLNWWEPPWLDRVLPRLESEPD